MTIIYLRGTSPTPKNETTDDLGGLRGGALCLVFGMSFWVSLFVVFLAT